MRGFTPRGGGEAARPIASRLAFVTALSAIVVVTCTAAWAAAGGGYFWPSWVILGCATVLLPLLWRQHLRGKAEHAAFSSATAPRGQRHPVCSTRVRVGLQRRRRPVGSLVSHRTRRGAGGACPHRPARRAAVVRDPQAARARRHAQPYAPSGRRRAGRRAAPHRTRPPRRCASQARRADHAAWPGRGRRSLTNPRRPRSYALPGRKPTWPSVSCETSPGASHRQCLPTGAWSRPSSP